MDTGLTRFVVLVVLFFLLTGDLAGMVKHVLEEAGYGKQTARHQRSAAGGAGDGRAKTGAEAASTTTGNPAGASDPDLEALGKLGVGSGGQFTVVRFTFDMDT